MEPERRSLEISKRRSRLGAGFTGVGLGTSIAILIDGYLQSKGVVLTNPQSTALGSVVTGMLTGAAICYHDIRGMLCSVIYRIWRRR